MRTSTSRNPPRARKLSASSTVEREADVRAAMSQHDYQRAVALLNHMYGAAIHQYIRQMIGVDDLADDVTQITFVQAYRDMKSFAGRSSLRTWLYSIARHRCLDALKVQKRRCKRFVRTGVIAESADTTPPVDQLLGDRALVVALAHCLQNLHPHTRTVVLLRYQEGFSYQQIADICHESPATLRARVSRALPLLRACLEKHGHG